MKRAKRGMGDGTVEAKPLHYSGIRRRKQQQVRQKIPKVAVEGIEMAGTIWYNVSTYAPNAGG